MEADEKLPYLTLESKGFPIKRASTILAFMLPDYPQSKEKLRKLLMKQAAKTRNAGFFSQLRKRIFFEGDKMAISREDGTFDISKPVKIESELKIKVKDLEKAKTSDVAQMMQSQAKEMHFKQSKFALKKIDKVVREAGNSFDLAGQPLTATKFLEIFEKLHTEFDDKGNPYMPSIVCGSEMAKTFGDILEKIDTDPELRKLGAEVINKKRREWLDRESRRKLVG